MLRGAGAGGGGEEHRAGGQKLGQKKGKKKGFLPPNLNFLLFFFMVGCCEEATLDAA